MVQFEINLLAKYLLLLSNKYFIVTLIILGYYTKFKNIFAKATIILLFSMILNTYLKSIWKVPLNSSIGKEGWAFPSGHMQSFFVFYGYLAWQFKNELTITIFIILSHLIAFSLVYLDYHNYYDVLAAVYFGFLTIIIHEFILNKLNQKHHKLFSLLVLCTSIKIYYLNPKFATHTLLAQSALIGFSIGWIVNQYDNIKTNNYIINIIFAFIGSIFIYYLINYTTKYVGFKISIFLKYFTIGLWISYGVEYINNKLNRRYQQNL